MDDIPDVLPLDAEAVLWSASSREVAIRPLLVLLHGYGSHEGDLFGLAPYLPLNPVIASVRAPLVDGGGHAWFPTSGGRHGAVPMERANAAARGVLAWLDTLPRSPSVGLLGFSQGGAIALQLLRLAPTRFAYAVQLSGFLVGPELESDRALTDIRTPVFWGRGTVDTVIPADAVERTRDWLPGHSTLTERIYEDLAHGVSPAEIAEIGAFIREHG
ncbi:alpha/beta hydrolase [Planctomonas psychrotolerans]|uniref:alpha/beta hydrolase n=1 Tax=Planctomonas psychrotolerans TaxID=2528712 RepID=UPI00123C08A3|nr:dienelactone hydrolase family protein [Planctomonas psychrotolerans]